MKKKFGEICASEGEKIESWCILYMGGCYFGFEIADIWVGSGQIKKLRKIVYNSLAKNLVADRFQNFGLGVV